MPEAPTELPWDAPTWAEDVTSWVHAQLAALGTPATGPLELIHQRPWSAFARIPTTRGTAFFKAPAPALRFEAPLTAALNRWLPAATAPLLASDMDRGWFLSADAGITLREREPTPSQVAHWLALLPRYAELQIALAERLPDLLALGVPDHRTATLPGLFERLLADREVLMLGQEGGLTADEHRALGGLRASVGDWCAQLAATGLPETLVHEEVHDANVLVDGERYVFIDWSDCSVGFPLCSLLVTLRAAAYRLKLDEHGPELAQLRAAYLEPWTRFASGAALLEAADTAYRLAMVMRALSWNAALHGIAAQHRAPYADNVPGWLQDFLAASALGGGAT